MKTHNLIPGSREWLAHRDQHFNASDAPAMMGANPNESRAQLMRRVYLGMRKEFSDYVQERVIDPGHRFEALARPLGDTIVGEALYPCVGTVGRLGASFDGLTLDDRINWEHKRLNAELRAAIRQQGGNANEFLPPLYTVQMEQQHLVSGAEKTLFMATDWDDSDNLLEERHCWYTPDLGLRQRIIDGWAQFECDLATYELPPATEAAPVGKTPDSLPALRIEVTGQVTASNLAEFKETALTAIRSVNRSLTTDADFADAEKAVKWCSDVETRLEAAKQHALSQTATIDALFRTIDDIAAEARRVRLDLNKLVTSRKTEVKEHAVAAARKAFDLHVAVINSEIAPMALRAVQVDFAGAIKGLRSISSMQDALDTTLAAAKITADTQGRAIRANVAVFKAATGDDRALQALFADLSTLVHKPGDDFALLVSSRIKAHHEAEAAKEAKRKADEAARIAAAEQRAREQEAARIAAAQAESARLEALAVSNRARLASEEQAKAGAAAALYATQSAPSTDVRACRPEDRAMLATPAGAELVAKAAAALRADAAPVLESSSAPSALAEGLAALAAEARASRFPSQPKMGTEWWARFFALADAHALEAA